jgi:hypothetical protein
MNRATMTGEITDGHPVISAVSPLRSKKPQTSNRSRATPRGFYQHRPRVMPDLCKVANGFLLKFDFTLSMVMQPVQFQQNGLS